MPKNIYSSIFNSQLEKVDGIGILYNQSSLLSKDLEFNTSAIALIPSLDLINHRNLFVSNKFAVSFDGTLSNSFLFFEEGERDVKKLYLRGDISMNEILLAKILFSERYSVDPEITLDPATTPEEGRDYIISGDENFLRANYERGISLADEVSELLDFPYVNFLFASPDKEALQKFNESVGPVDIVIDEQIGDILGKLSYGPEVNKFMMDNLGSLYYDMTENEMSAVNELMRLLFYHGIIDDMFDVKFV